MLGGGSPGVSGTSSSPVTALSMTARSRFRLLPQFEYRVCTETSARSAIRITVAAA
jgi:hypothetical protein